MARDMIRDILARKAPGGAVSVQGWARTVRAQKNVVFMQLNDGSCLADLQAVIRELVTRA